MSDQDTKTILSGLDEDDQAALDDIEEISEMNPDDLEYPDMDSILSSDIDSIAASELDEDDVDDDTIDLNSDLDDIDESLNAIDEELIDGQDVAFKEHDEGLHLPNEAPGADAPTKKTGEIDSDHLNSLTISELEDELYSLNKDDFSDRSGMIRYERKIKKTIKDIESEKKKKQEQELKESQEERERLNNIVPVKELLETAVNGEDIQHINPSPPPPQTVPEEQFTEVHNTSLQEDSKLIDQTENITTENDDTKKIDVTKINLKQEYERVKQKLHARSIHEAFTRLLRYFPSRQWYVVLSVNIFVLLGEIAKSTVPALVVLFYVINQNKTTVGHKALENLVSGNPLQIELGLKIIKENYPEDQKKFYYDIVKRHIEKKLANSWSTRDKISGATLSSEVVEINQMKFSDGRLINLEKIIAQTNRRYQKTLKQNYELFYETEKSKINDQKALDHLRQANIFLGQNECLKAFEHFTYAKNYLPESKAVDQGKVLGIHCAASKGNIEVVESFHQIEKMDDVHQYKVKLEKSRRNRMPASLYK